MFRKLCAGYAVLVGVSMLGIWTMLLSTGQVPELVTSPVSIAFHLVAEIATALMLIAAGLGYYHNRAWGERVMLISLGMLLYTVVNSSGYYAQSGEWSFVAMFTILFVLALLFLSGLPKQMAAPRETSTSGRKANHRNH